MIHLRAAAAAATGLMLASGCVTTPLLQVPPSMPEAGEGVLSNAANGGRVQSIAVNPTNRRNAIIATQFGGLWKTYNAGDTWFRVYTLPTVYVTDVEYAADGQTVVATVFRDNQTQAGGGGGIYVSRTNGDFWSRPPTGIVPVRAGTTGPTSAHAVSRAPDERGLWYVGSDFGVAISRDDGATWTHTDVAGSPIQSVLAFPGGIVLAMAKDAVWRSDDRGGSWRVVVTDDFSQFAPAGNPDGNASPSGNKMDRAPDRPWAFIFRSFAASPPHGSGGLWFYELDTDRKTQLALPQGRSRGAFVRVTRDELLGGSHLRVWVGTGWDGYYVIRGDAAAFRALVSTPDHDDWVSFIAEAGIHADMGDLGLDGDGNPAMMGSDGGIFRPRQQEGWWAIGGQHKWMSAAKPGSSMNSLQISDLAGTNFHRPDGSVTTSLYLTTQDNQLYTTPDGGATWKVGDGSEGFGLEARVDANEGEAAQLVFVAANGGGDTFADANVTNRRPVPRVDLNGNVLDGWQNPYLVGQQPGSSRSNWVRRRIPAVGAVTEVHFSNDSGESWFQFATANFKFAGEVRTVGPVAWLPVFLGGVGNEIGLVPLATATPPGLPPPVYDDSDVVRLPGNGSLGQRFTEFDKHAIYGVDPGDWRHVIAPDIVGNDVKITRDGGTTWHRSDGLTAEVLRGGKLKMWGGKADLMEVTEIAFDPYHAGRVLVGTRDAGIVCTGDDGHTWRTIFDSDKISYITGFHFLPNGTVFISSYGHGLWRLDAAQGCPKTYAFPWDVPSDVVVAAEGLARDARPPTPRAIPAPDRPKLFAVLRTPSEGAAAVTDSLALSGRGFSPGEDVTLRVRGVDARAATVRADGKGQFATTLSLPELPHGTFTVEARGAKGVLTASEFERPYSD